MPITAVINRLFGHAGYEDEDSIVSHPGVADFCSTALVNSWRRLTRHVSDLDKRFRENEKKISDAEDGEKTLI